MNDNGSIVGSCGLGAWPCRGHAPGQMMGHPAQRGRSPHTGKPVPVPDATARVLLFVLFFWFSGGHLGDFTLVSFTHDHTSFVNLVGNSVPKELMIPHPSSTGLHQRKLKDSLGRRQNSGCPQPSGMSSAPGEVVWLRFQRSGFLGI